MQRPVVSLDDFLEHRENLELAVVMHSTSSSREEAARLLARIVEEVGAHGAAYGWTDDLEPSVLAPVQAVSRGRRTRWEAKLARTFMHAIDVEERETWHLMIRGAEDEQLRRAAPLLSYAIGWLGGSEPRDCPQIPALVHDGPYSRFLALLDAYRFVAFRIGRPSHRSFLQGELRRALQDDDTAGEAVVAAFGNLERLGSSLLALGRDLEARTLRAEAAGVYVIAYELALMRLDPELGAEAARSAARAFRMLPDWGEALRWYGVAQRIAEHVGDLPRLARVLNGLANTYRERGDFPTARTHCRDAWEVAQAADDPGTLANVAHGMMILEREAGEIGAALGYGWVALRNQPDPTERASLLINVGTLLRDGGDVEAAERAYRIAHSLAGPGDLRVLAQDALAYCAALRGDAIAYELLRPRAPEASPYLRVQIGYYRGAALRALGDARADRVLSAVERYARAHSLAEWDVKASLLRSAPAPASRPSIETPATVRDGLRALEESLT